MTNADDPQAMNVIRKRAIVTGFAALILFLIRLVAFGQQSVERQASFQATNSRAAIDIMTTGQARIDQILGTPAGENTIDSLQALYDSRLAALNDD